jgi:hypothetical protein
MSVSVLSVGMFQVSELEWLDLLSEDLSVTHRFAGSPGSGGDPDGDPDGDGHLGYAGPLFWLSEQRAEPSSDLCPWGMVEVEYGEAGACVGMVEATRPAATDEHETEFGVLAILTTDSGFDGAQAMAGLYVLPWQRMTRVEAEVACGRAGLSLCPAEVVELVCDLGSGQDYPYGDSWQEGHCNDSSGMEGPVATGTFEDCVDNTGEVQAYDLVGNLAEWTYRRPDSDEVAFGLRGGAWDSWASDATCDSFVAVLAEGEPDDNSGFRCCALQESIGSHEYGADSGD